MDVIADFEALIREVRDARPVPFSASAIVDRRALLERLETLLEAVPGELKKARWIIEDREEVLARIQREAQETLERARRERDRMLSRPEIDRAASVEAERVIDGAKAQAREIRLEAEHFVDGKLASLEVGLQKMLALVQSASTSFTDVSGPPPRPGVGPKRGPSRRLALEPEDEQAGMRPADPLDVPHTEARPVQPVIVATPPAGELRPAPAADLQPEVERVQVVQRRPAPAADRPPALERRPSPRTQASSRERSRAPRSPAQRGSDPAPPVPASPAGVEPIPPRLEPKKREDPGGRSAVRTLGLGSPPRPRSSSPRPSSTGQVPPRQADPGASAGMPGAQAPPAPGAPAPVPGSERDAARPRPRSTRRETAREEAATPPPASLPDRIGESPGERVAESERTGTVRVIRTRGSRPEAD